MLPASVLALGLVQGALAAIDALGLVLLYRATRIVNLAQPAMGLVGGALTGILVVSAGWSFWWAAPVGIVVGASLGLATDRLVLRRLQDAPRAVILVVTVGLAQIFGAISVAMGFALAGGRLPTYSLDLGLRNKLFGVIGGIELLALLTLPLAWAGTWYFLHRSRFGLASLALGQEAERARALGVSAAVVRAVVWSVAGVLASLSGILTIPALGFQLGGAFGPIVLLLALAPAVLAGFRSLHLAVFSALSIGVVYQLAVFHSGRGGLSDAVLAAVVVLAIAVYRRRHGRAEAAARASSWEAAATPRPLSASLLRRPSIRVGSALLVVAALIAAAIPPLFLLPSGDVGYALGASRALAAVGIAIAWMFAGEISLGHWGFAGIGGVVAALTPGPWPVRAVAATLALASLGALLALLSRGRSVLAFAVLSLAAAATAQGAIIRVVGRTVPASAGVVASVTAVAGIAVAIGAVWLRRTSVGARMIAARDDPQRAPWLGARPARERLIALTISTAIAGLAGALFFASSQGGLITTSFEAGASLDLLSLAVIGGLGSSVGAFLGAAGVYAGRIFLPGTWEALLYGVGVIVVVMFMPGGLSRVLNRARDLAARLIGGNAPPPPPPVTPPLERERVPV